MSETRFVPLDATKRKVLERIAATKAEDWNRVMNHLRATDHEEFHRWRSLQGSRIEGKDLGRRNLCGGLFTDSFITDSSFSGGGLRAVDFSRCRLERVDFTAALLLGVNFAGATLIGCRFNRARIYFCNFDRGVIVDTDFGGAAICKKTFRTLNYRSFGLAGCKLRQRLGGLRETLSRLPLLRGSSGASR